METLECAGGNTVVNSHASGLTLAILDDTNTTAETGTRICSADEPEVVIGWCGVPVPGEEGSCRE